MTTQAITIQVDSDAARIYRSASDEDRRKLDLMLNLHLHEITRPDRPLMETVRDIARRAQQRGLTPEILQQILDER